MYNELFYINFRRTRFTDWLEQNFSKYLPSMVLLSECSSTFSSTFWSRIHIVVGLGECVSFLYYYYM